MIFIVLEWFWLFARCARAGVCGKWLKCETEPAEICAYLVGFFTESAFNVSEQRGFVVLCILEVTRCKVPHLNLTVGHAVKRLSVSGVHAKCFEHFSCGLVGFDCAFHKWNGLAGFPRPVGLGSEGYVNAGQNEEQRPEDKSCAVCKLYDVSQRWG